MDGIDRVQWLLGHRGLRVMLREAVVSLEGLVTIPNLIDRNFVFQSLRRYKLRLIHHDSGI